MIFTEISSEELRQFQEKNNHRFFFQQDASYSELTKKNNLKTKILAVIENSELLAYSTFIYFPYKKFFYKVTTQYGPIMDYTNTELVTFYMEQLKNYYSKNLRVLCVRVNPFLNEKYFNDIKFISENEDAINTNRILTNLNFHELNDDLFTNPTLASRCIFSKKLDNTFSEENLLKGFSTLGKRSITKAIKDGIEVKEINIYDSKDAKIFDDINKSTENRINFQIRDSEYFKSLKSVLNKKLHLMVSYLNCDSLILKIENELVKLNNDRNKLLEKIEDIQLANKKTLSKLNTINDAITFNTNKLNKIISLKQEYNCNIIYLSCASFIESKQDFIYLTGGMKKELSRFNGSYLVMFKMIKYAINNNFKYFNFFGTSKDFESEDATDYGVLQFKRNFNGNIEYFMDNYEIRNAIGKIWKI